MPNAARCQSLQNSHDNIASAVDAAVVKVASNPNIGEQNRGDFAQLYVYTFRIKGQLCLLAYTLDDEVRLVYLETAGPHENFYRDIKR